MAAADAATLVVTVPLDSGPGTLRQATVDALPGDTIVIDASVTTISLNSQLVIENSISIIGGGTSRPTINGQNSTRLIFVLPTGNLTLSHLALSNGRVGDRGGAILNDGHVAITDVLLENNIADSMSDDVQGGGAIANGGTMTIARSWLRSNAAEGGSGIRVGGAVWNYGSLSITDSTLWYNFLCCSGGGGAAIAAGFSGAAGTTTIERATIVGNDIFRPGAQGVVHGVGVFGLFVPVTLRNSVVVANFSYSFTGSRPIAFSNLSGVTARGYNVVGATDAPIAPSTGDQLNVDDWQSSAWFPSGFLRPGLLTDTATGAAVFTPTPQSPMVNAGSGTGAPPIDQVGNRRVVGCAMDVGAVELQPLPATLTLTTPTVVEWRRLFDVTAAATSDERCTIEGVVEFFLDGEPFATVATVDGEAVARISIVATGEHTIRAVLHAQPDYAAAETTKQIRVATSIPALSPAMLLFLAVGLSIAALIAFRD